MQVKLVNPNFQTDYINNLLQARGVTDVEAYLHPTRDLLADPELLENIDAGAQLYLSNIGAGKHILIVVDSDNDGFTSATIIYQYTKQLAPETEISYFLHEGKQHGLQDHIQKLLDSNIHYDLIILPDSSSNDISYHNMLIDVNTPCLVLDHHITDVPISANAIVVNNQLSPNYPNKELTGAGVVYQFCRYLDRKTNHNWADNYLDLAAWGIIGDLALVTNLENRYIIQEGLSHINNLFLKALMEKQAYSITGEVDPPWNTLVDAMNPTSVAFYIVPLVNAMIRVGTMPEKERLFRAFVDGDALVPSGKRGAKGELEHIAIEACRECTNAKSKQNRIKDNVIPKLELKIAKNELLDNQVLFIRLEDDDDFPAELNGLMAMQLSAKYKRPTIVARLNNEGYIRGSARGVNDSELTDFKQFLTDSGLFEYAQGHANAFGCSIKDKDLRAFHQYANEKLGKIDFGETYYHINFERFCTDQDLPKLIADIAQYDDIWGQGNPTPLIYIKGLVVKPSDFTIMGKNHDTVKVESNGISYLKFKGKSLIEQLSTYTAQHGNKEMRFELVGEANLNNWMGRVTPQIFITDYDIKFNNIIEF